MYICVDFDGTIVDHRYPDTGPPAPGAIEWLREWQKNGAKIILFTMRSDSQQEGAVLKLAVQFLKGYGIELYGINENPDQYSWTKSPKAYAHIYVDDAAIGCPLTKPNGFVRPCVNWEIIGPRINQALLDYRDSLIYEPYVNA